MLYCEEEKFPLRSYLWILLVEEHINCLNSPSTCLTSDMHSIHEDISFDLKNPLVVIIGSMVRAGSTLIITSDLKGYIFRKTIYFELFPYESCVSRLRLREEVNFFM